MLTVACVLVRGHVGYTPDYVARLHSMVHRHLKRDYRFICLTDRPDETPPGILPMRIPSFDGYWAWWSKIHLFDVSITGDKGRLLYLDLDTLVTSSLDPIVDYPSSFALIPHAGDFKGKHGLKVVKKFNSSVMIMDAGSQSRLREDWDYRVARRLWGDQDWIGEQAPDADVMPLEWFPRLSQIGADGLVPRTAKVILCKKPKNHVAAQKWPWFKKLWISDWSAEKRLAVS